MGFTVITFMRGTRMSVESEGSVCRSEVHMDCMDTDGRCRQPMKVWCMCPAVNKHAVEWLREQGYEYDGKKMRRLE